MWCALRETPWFSYLSMLAMVLMTFWKARAFSRTTVLSAPGRRRRMPGAMFWFDGLGSDRIGLSKLCFLTGLAVPARTGRWRVSRAFLRATLGRVDSQLRLRLPPRMALPSPERTEGSEWGSSEEPDWRIRFVR